jgi:hypothetical protein
MYHIGYLVSYILSPATITIAIADAFNATTDIDIWGSFMLACLPVVVFLIVCYQNWKEEIKIGFAVSLFSIILQPRKFRDFSLVNTKTSTCLWIC